MKYHCYFCRYEWEHIYVGYKYIECQNCGRCLIEKEAQSSGFKKKDQTCSEEATEK